MDWTKYNFYNFTKKNLLLLCFFSKTASLVKILFCFKNKLEQDRNVSSESIFDFIVDEGQSRSLVLQQRKSSNGYSNQKMARAQELWWLGSP